MKKRKTEAGKTNRISSPLSHKLFMPMILLSLLQMGVFFITLALGGEFSYIKKYVYNMFSEKTENRRNYVENMLNDKVEPLYDAVLDIISMTEAYLVFHVLKDNSRKHNNLLIQPAYL